jgi:hypothetical protein
VTGKPFSYCGAQIPKVLSRKLHVVFVSLKLGLNWTYRKNEPMIPAYWIFSPVLVNKGVIMIKTTKFIAALLLVAASVTPMLARAASVQCATVMHDGGGTRPGPRPEPPTLPPPMPPHIPRG